MLAITRIFGAALLTAALALPAGPALAADREALFISPASAINGKATSDSAEMQLARGGKMAVKINPAMAKLSPGTEVDLETPDGRIFSVTFDKLIEHTPNGGHSWIGHLSDHGDEYRVVLTITGGIVTGRIVTPDGVLRVVYENGGAFVQDDKMMGMEAVQIIEDDGREIPAELKNMPDPLSGAAGAAASSAQSKAISTIDVLILYNDAFATRYPGAQLQNRLNSLLAITNQAYSDSQVEIVARIVAAQQISYSNTISNNTALDQITNNTVAGTDVHALRNTFGADLVVLMRPFERPQHGSCGVAWVSSASPNSNFGFSIVSDGNDLNGSNFFCDDFTFAHEMGHNEGCTHDRANASVTPAFPYSYGYGFSGSFGTVMSYINPSIGRFSNPNISTCNGSPCGVASGPDAADNARTLNNLKDAIAAFRATAQVNLVTLTVQKTGNGTVTSPSGINCGATCSQQVAAGTAVTLTATPAGGSQFNGWSNCPAPNGNQCDVTVNTNTTITANFSNLQGTLAQAIDNAALNVSTSGNANWFIQNTVVQVGNLAAQSGDINDNGASHMDTSVTGPGTVSFWWRVSSEVNFDFLRFYINGVQQDAISGTPGWAQRSFNLGAGQNNLRWSYTKDVNTSSGSDAGWVDGVVITASNFDLNVLKTGSGTVTSNTGISCGATCSQSLPANTAVTLTATPAGGYQFSSWANCPAPSGNVCNLTLNADTTVTANFTLQPPSMATLNVQKTGNGTVTSNTGINCGSACSQQLNVGTAVVLTASPAAGNQFNSWSNCPAPSGNTCSLTLNANTTVTANFIAAPPATATLNVLKTGNGTVSSNVGINCGATCSQQLNVGTAVVLTASPAAGNQFNNWSNCPAPAGNTCNLTLNANTTVTANFGVAPPATANINILKDGDGTVTSNTGLNCGSLCSQSLPLGSNVILTATAASDHVFDSWLNCQLPNGSTCTVALNASRTVTAKFNPMLGLPGQPTHFDLGGDGKADIVLRDSRNGFLSMFMMDNNQRTALNIGALAQEWRVIGVADLGGDGKADLVIRHNNGALGMYEMDSNQRTYRHIGALSVVWKVVGIADLNGDSRADIVIRNQNTGQLYVYFMNNNLRTGQNIGALGLVWSVVGVKDLGGDGMADIVLRHNNSGQLYMYQMNGAQRTGRNIGALSPVWSVAALADTGGDGNADMVLRHNNTGQLFLYRMNNNLRTGFNIGALNPVWTVVGAADFNGDGRADLLLRHNNSGQLFMYQMNNNQRTGFNIGALSPNFMVASPADNKE